MQRRQESIALMEYGHAGQCLLVIHSVNSFERGRQWLQDKNQSSSVCVSVIFFLALIDHQFQIRQLRWIPEAVCSRPFSTADRMRGWTNYSHLMINENNNSDRAATKQARGWLEAQFLMSIQGNMCCPRRATVDKETRHFNSHADHKQRALKRDRASSGTLKKLNSLRVSTKTRLYSAQQIIKSREVSCYLAGVGSRNEKFQSLSFQFCEPSIAVLTPYHSFTARWASTAWGRRPSPETRGAAQRAGRFSPNPWRDGSRRSREGARWGDPRAWGRGACGARHGAGTLWSRTSARAGSFIVSFSVPRVWKERRRFGWGRIRHLRGGDKEEMKRTC